jgi:hypothetical protein
MKDGNSPILYTKETRGMITLITRAWVMLTLLTRERREYCRHVPDDSRSRAVIAHCHVSELQVPLERLQPILKLALRGLSH